MKKIKKCNKKQCRGNVQNLQAVASYSKDQTMEIRRLGDEIKKLKEINFDRQEHIKVKTQLMTAIAQMVDAASHALLVDRR